MQSEPSNRGVYRLGALALTLAFGLFAFSVWALGAFAQTGVAPTASSGLFAEREQTKKQIDQLNQQIEERKNAASDIQNQIEGYGQKIEQTRNKATTLETEIELIDNKIKKTELDLESTQNQIDTVNLEISSLDLQIKDKTERIGQMKDVVAEYIRTLYTYDNKSEIEVLLANDSFSDFFDQIKYLEDVEGDISKTVTDMISLKADLETERKGKDAKKTALASLQKKLDDARDALNENKVAKMALAENARQNETSLKQQLQGLRDDQAAVDAEMAKIQLQLKQKLRENDKFANLADNAALIWPVDPGRGITTYFHDPDYPFRYVFEHPGLDIRAAQGSLVRAAGSGFVATAHDGGMGYSYVMLVHPGNLATVYGHLSKILVNEDQFVERGQVIGYSGAMPGTPGAGRLTTGPHLHFEVRVDGIPTDPLAYLAH